MSNTAKFGFTDSIKRLTQRVTAAFTPGKELRAAGLTQLELWREMFPDMFIGFDPKAPGITEKTGQKLAVVFSCLNVLGETYGSLPCDVKQNTAKGKVTVSDDPVHYLVHDRPNPYTTAFDFWSTMQKLRKAWGNAYAEIERFPTGVPKALWLRMPWEVTLKQSPSKEVYYEYQGRIIAYPDMLHWKNYSENGYTGISSIKHNALTMGLGLKLKNYNSSIIGERPYGYLSSATRPKDGQAKKALQDQWQNPNKEEGTASEKNRYKMGTMGGIPVLYGGLEFHSMTLPADDVQYIESAKLTEREIYGIFRMPPTMAGDWEKAPYNSSEQQVIVFVKFTLADIRGVEQECNEKLFPESNKTAKNKRYIKFNLQGLLRGDTATRVNLYRALVNLGAMSPYQVADLEDLSTDGVSKEYFMQMNMAPVDILGEVQKAKVGGNAAAEPATEEQRQQIMEELREQIRARLNGHYKDVADILEQ